MTVSELIPGDLVTLAGTSAVFVHRGTHPLWPALMLVVWRLEDGGWSLDALSAFQEVGVVAPSTAAVRETRLRAALLSQGQQRRPG